MAVKKDDAPERESPVPSSEEPAPAKASVEAEASASQEPTAGVQSEKLRGAPVWVAPLFVAGLVLVYLGERVFEASPTARLIATWLCVAAVLVSTFVRLATMWRAPAATAREIERLLTDLVVSARCCYFATTEPAAPGSGSSLARDSPSACSASSPSPGSSWSA
jgi:hypothetical protein